MTSWLTTHYPHPSPDNHPWHIYLQRQHRQAVQGIQCGDQVFFYEFASQKPEKGMPKHPLGAQGIVRVAYVSGDIYQRDTVIEYQDGTTGFWSWGVPTERGDTQGFLSRGELCNALEYKPGYSLRGFAGGSGVKRLTDTTAMSLYAMFKAGSPPTARR